jgi:flagellar hook-basal body complex protein FliE
MNPIIAALPNVTNPVAHQGTQAVADGKSDDFARMLMDVLKEVNASQANAQGLQDAFMAGQPVEIHDLKIAMERANVAMQLTLQVRNKLLDAYSQIMQMQV